MGTYRNPILPGCHPDPSVCRVGDTFYLVTSTFEYLPGLPIHRSGNLVDWEHIGHAIERPGQLDLAGLPGSKGLYAPTLRHHDGRFFVVCTVVGVAGWGGRTGHFIVTADDAAGPWSDPVWFDDVPGIDPSLTFDGDRVWLCATRQIPAQEWSGQGEIWVREVDPGTWRFIGDEHVIWHGAAARATWTEGPHIVAGPDGGWVLVTAEGGTDRDHAVCIAYADEITGPYAGDRGNPRLTHRDLGDQAPIANVGHADLVEAPDGRWWATMLGTCTTPDRGSNGLLGRQTHLVPVAWERGRLLFAPGSGRVAPEMTADGVPDQQPWPTRLPDGFGSGELDAAWNGVRRFPQQFLSFAGDGAGVRLVAGAEPHTRDRQAALLRRLPAPRVTVSADIRLRLAPGAQGVGLRGGVILRTSEEAYLEASVSGDGRVRVTRRTRAEGEVECGSVVLDAAHVAEGGAVPFVVHIRDLHARVEVGGAHVADASLEGLATGGASMFVGCWIGALAVGTGAVDVDRFVVDVEADPV